MTFACPTYGIIAIIGLFRNEIVTYAGSNLMGSFRPVVQSAIPSSGSFSQVNQ